MNIDELEKKLKNASSEEVKHVNQIISQLNSRDDKDKVIRNIQKEDLVSDIAEAVASPITWLAAASGIIVANNSQYNELITFVASTATGAAVFSIAKHLCKIDKTQIRKEMEKLRYIKRYHVLSDTTLIRLLSTLAPEKILNRLEERIQILRELGLPLKERIGSQYLASAAFF